MILTTTFLPVVGGLQYFLKWFLDSLDQRLARDANLEVHFAYPNAEAEEYVQFGHIHTHDLDVGQVGKFKLGGIVVRVGRLLRKIRPQVVHCHSVSPDGLCVLMASRMFGVQTDVIVTSHGQDLVSIPEMDYGSLRTAKGRLVARQVTRRLSAHVVVSNAMVDRAVAAGTQRNRVEVIHNGVPVRGDPDFEDDGSVDRSVEMPPLPDGGIYILSLSSGRRLKNLSGLVEAMAMAGSELGSSKLILACTGPLAGPIEQLVSEKGLSDRIVFCGEITGARKRAYFEASDVYCIPSHFEAFGLVALEAMKLGVAVVATRAGGLADFVQNEYNGLLVEPSDPADIASALVRLYRTPELRVRLTALASETIGQFSISSVVERHLALYRRRLAARHV